jgi:hypothetical protein
MSFNMNQNQNQSAIRLTPEQEAEVAQMNSVSEIQTAMRRFALEQRLVEPDLDGVLREVERPQIPANAPHVKSLVVDGTKYLIEGKNAAEVAAAELNLLRSLFGGKAAPTEEQPRDAATGQFVASTDDPRRRRARPVR